MEHDAMTALVMEPLHNFAALLQAGDVPGDQAGELLELVLLGIERNMEQRQQGRA